MFSRRLMHQPNIYRHSTQDRPSSMGQTMIQKHRSRSSGSGESGTPVTDCRISQQPPGERSLNSGASLSLRMPVGSFGSGAWTGTGTVMSFSRTGSRYPNGTSLESGHPNNLGSRRFRSGDSGGRRNTPLFLIQKDSPGQSGNIFYVTLLFRARNTY